MGRVVLSAPAVRSLVAGCGDDGRPGDHGARARRRRGRQGVPVRRPPARPDGALAGAGPDGAGAAPHAGRLEARHEPALAGALPAARLLRHLRQLDPLDRRRAARGAARRARRDARGRRRRLLLELARRPGLAGLPPARAAADPRARLRRRAPGARSRGSRWAGSARWTTPRGGRARSAPRRRSPASCTRSPRRTSGSGCSRATPTTPTPSGAIRGRTATSGASTTRRRCCPRWPGSRCSSRRATGVPARSRTAGATSTRRRSRSGTRRSAFVRRARALGIPVRADLYGAGIHDWPYWQRELHRALPLLLGAIRG